MCLKDIKEFLPIVPEKKLPLAEKLIDMYSYDFSRSRLNEIAKLLPLVTKENMPLVERMKKREYSIPRIIKDLPTNTIY